MTRCMVVGGTRLQCPTLLRLGMNPLGYCRLMFGLIQYRPSTICRSVSSVCHHPPTSQLVGCSVAHLTPSASKSAPLHFNATTPSPPTDRWLSCCPFACLCLSASASAFSCTPPFVVCWLLRGIFGPLPTPSSLYRCVFFLLPPPRVSPHRHHHCCHPSSIACTLPPSFSSLSHAAIFNCCVVIVCCPS